MKRIDSDIKNNEIKNAYLLYGPERYLLLQYRNKLVDAITGFDDTMNFARFEGENTTVEEIIDLAETLPFFSEKRCILIENSPFASDPPDKLLDYLKQIPETTYLIFCEKEIRKKSRFYNAVDKNGTVVEFVNVDDRTMRAWINQKLRTDKKVMSSQVLEYFLSLTGNDMAYISMEYEKVISYTGEREEIKTEDIDAVCSVQIEDKIFEMIDAITVHNEKKAFDLYYDLLALKVAPVKILVLLARNYRILLIVKSMNAQGASKYDIASTAGIRDFTVQKYAAQARDYSVSELQSIIEEISDLDYAFKSGNLSEQISVELFIIKHAKKPLE